MRLKDEPRRLVIRNSPRLWWIPGVLVALVGAVCLLAAAGPIGDAGACPMGGGLGGAAVGVLLLALGVWACWRMPRATLAVDRAGQTVTLTRRGLFRTAAERYPADAIVDVRVKKERRGKGSALYRVEFLLDSGRVVPVPLAHPRDRDGCMRVAGRLAGVLGLPGA